VSPARLSRHNARREPFETTFLIGDDIRCSQYATGAREKQPDDPMIRVTRDRNCALTLAIWSADLPLKSWRTSHTGRRVYPRPSETRRSPTGFIDRRHFQWHLVVEFLSSVDGLTFAELMDDRLSEELARAEMMAWYERG
jgi:hypothetical protein